MSYSVCRQVLLQDFSLIELMEGFLQWNPTFGSILPADGFKRGLLANPLICQGPLDVRMEGH